MQAHLCFLMSDVVGSTKILRALEVQCGREAEKIYTLQFWNPCKEIFHQAIKASRGTVHDDISDQIAAFFEYEGDGISCAVNIQRELSRRAIAVPVGVDGGRLRVRMALSSDTMDMGNVNAPGSVRSAAFSRLSRVVGIALPDQILITKNCFEAAGDFPGKASVRTHEWSGVPLAKQAGKADLVEVLHSASMIPRNPAEDVPGNLSREQVKQPGERLVVFVSVGGTCRDPIAKAITEWYVARNPQACRTRAVAAAVGAPGAPEVSEAARNAVRELLHEDLLEGVKTRSLTADLIKDADLILLMQASLQNPKVHPPNKTFLFKPFFGLSGDVKDPWPGPGQEPSREEYSRCAKELFDILVNRFDQIVNFLANSEEGAPSVALGASPVIEASKGKPGTPQGTDLSLSEWLLSPENRSLRGECDEVLQRRYPHYIHMNDTMVFHTAKGRMGYPDPVVRLGVANWSHVHDLVVSANPSSDTTGLQIDSRLEGVKAAPIRISPPLDHDPTALVIDAAEIPYSLYHAFDNKMRTDEVARQAVRFRAFDFDSSHGRTIPGSLCVHVILILDDRFPVFVLSHRPQRDGSFNGDRWSASFEEQFNPRAWNDSEGRSQSPDKDLAQTAIRGVQEEFGITPDFVEDIVLRFYALEVELDGLNIGVIAVMRFPSLTFDQLGAAWRRLRNPEHNDIGFLPFTPHHVRAAIVATGPGAVAGFSTLTGREDFQPHAWDTTSRLRMACALWLIE